MKDFSWKEFKPTLTFLAKFLGFYVVSSLIYGVYVSHYGKQADPLTYAASVQSSWILTAAGWPTHALNHTLKATTLMIYDKQALLAVYEGCNGVNVMIIFVSFLLAFGPYTRALAWFIPMGLAVIHLGNLLRIIALFWITLYYPAYLYFLHKYLFTAFLYVIVFALWIVWVRQFSLKQREH